MKKAMIKNLFYILTLFLCVNFCATEKNDKKNLAKKTQNVTEKSTLTSFFDDEKKVESPLSENENRVEKKEELTPVLYDSEVVNSEKMIFSAWDATTRPWDFTGNEHAAMMLNFSSTDLGNVLKYFEETFGVIFITDDAINPPTAGGKSLIGSKINFSTNRPVSRKEAWNILITLLETAGVTLQPGSMERTYRVVTLAKDSPYSYRKGPLPVYIGIDPEDLPEGDFRIRYVYQVKNTSLEAVKSIIQTMASPASPDPIEIPEIYAVLITDRVYNIKTMLAVIKELDQSTVPESMSIIKLKKADAQKISDLYKTIIKEEMAGQASPARLLGPKRSDTILYFDSTVRVIPEPRTNILIAIGPIEGLKKIEKFIQDYEDQDNKIPYTPTRVYQLKYTIAEAVAGILESALDFKSDTDAGKTGGVRNGDKFFSNVTIVAEPITNSLLITAPDDEYWHVYELLQKIDIEQAQVALDVMMVSVSTSKNKALGTQIRNSPGQMGPNLNFQTGVIDPVTGVIGNYSTDNSGNVVNGNSRLLSNLLQLVTGGPQPTGTTILTLGSDPNGIWGILRLLQTQTEARVIQNPFIVTTNKYEAVFNAGETRRIPSTSISNDNYTSQSYTSDDAKIQVRITPQISDSGMVTLDINIENSEFTGPAGDTITSGNKSNRSMYTSVLIDDGGIIVIGGLGYESTLESQREVPFLSKIPLIGWLFKNRQEQKTKSLLLVFIRTQVIQPTHKISKEHEKNISNQSKKYIQSSISKNSHCPINRWFFEDDSDMKASERRINQFMQQDTKEVSHA